MSLRCSKVVFDFNFGAGRLFEACECAFFPSPPTFSTTKESYFPYSQRNTFSFHHTNFSHAPMPITFLAEMGTRTVHDPYALAMPTVQIMEPLIWNSGGDHPVLIQEPYDRPQGLPSKVLCGFACVEHLAHLIRLRLGGICCDLRPIEIANVIFEASGVVCAGVDLFTRNKGCCSVWVRSEQEAAAIRTAMHHCVWMGPPSLGFAVRARNLLSVSFLEEELHKQVKLRAECFPRHLVTVERYVTFEKPEA